MIFDSNPMVSALIKRAYQEHLKMPHPKSTTQIGSEAGFPRNRNVSILKDGDIKNTSYEMIHKAFGAMRLPDYQSQLMAALKAEINLKGYSGDKNQLEFVKNENRAVDDDFETALMAMDGRQIVYDCCTHTKGASFNEIKGLKKINHPEVILKELLVMGLVTIGEDGNYYAVKNDYSLSDKTLPFQIRNYLNCWNIDNMGKEINFIKAQVGQVTKLARKEIYFALVKLQDLVRFHMKNSPGDEHIVIAYFMDELVKKEIRKND